ncbi:hypothetical protein MUU74_17040 [Chryseobacterium daecheongense]|uniref:hypothetical protein n=1 Tax=Chryseobacterium daecheongense TaxID=192389 RepID=UPI001FD7065C|nr:hypothetical protein [Chryseobacterium daecheongense]UOU98178.1 hypothetical protein MUU74_17005 [Chryseobacterium daecheongense]UOU98185.1 hypothetical protein MUU74_17040 [Chryseobacterium daecheongense]
MDEGVTKKIIPLIILGFIILFFVLKNNNKKQSIERNPKYTVVKILNAEVFGKNFTKYTIILNGKKVYSYGNRLLGKDEREEIIGKRVFLEYDSTNIKNSNIFIDILIPDTLQVPENGWKYKPDWANK